MNRRMIGWIVLICMVLTPLTCRGEAASFDGLAGTPADYADQNNWMLCPDRAEYEADVIFLYPSTYMDPEGGALCGIADGGMRLGAKEVYAQMGSCFEGVANVYVPYYRQLNIAKFAEMTAQEIADFSWQEPRTDLYAMLDHYFENLNGGRPFILAGHSQGSNMLVIILDEYMEKRPEYRENMVAAYMLGVSLTETLLAENPHLKAASGETDTGVVVSWNTEGAGNADAGTTLIVREGSVAINPLNWKTDDSYAGVSLNRGSLVPSEDGSWVVGAGIADAQLDLKRGTVICKSVDPAKYVAPETVFLFGPESYHMQDYAFYYVNLRENAAARIAAFVK